MPKQKTRKSVAKRFKITPRGKIIRGHQMASHNKNKKRKYRLYRQKRTAFVSKAEAKKIRQSIPYS